MYGCKVFAVDSSTLLSVRMLTDWVTRRSSGVHHCQTDISLRSSFAVNHQSVMPNLPILLASNGMVTRAILKTVALVPFRSVNSIL